MDNGLPRPFQADRRPLPLLFCVYLHQVIDDGDVFGSGCAQRLCLKLLNTSDLPRRKALVMDAF